jgi:hypothetical protein
MTFHKNHSIMIYSIKASNLKAEYISTKKVWFLIGYHQQATSTTHY